MKTVEAILAEFHQKCPPRLAETWDNVGLLIGDPKVKTDGVVIADDLSHEAVESAVAHQYRLITVHHPCIFPSHRGIRRLVASESSQEALNQLMLRCIRENVAVAALHTNFDRAAQAVPEQVSKGLGLQVKGRLFEKLSEIQENPGLDSLGYGVFGDLNQEETFSGLARRVKTLFQVRSCRVTPSEPKYRVRRVAFTPGKGSAFLKAAARAGCDVFVTGEVDYHEALLAMRMGMTVIELGHRESELFFLLTMEQWVKKEKLKPVVINSPVQRWIEGD